MNVGRLELAKTTTAKSARRHSAAGVAHAKPFFAAWTRSAHTVLLHANIASASAAKRAKVTRVARFTVCRFFSSFLRAAKRSEAA
jgi:hypothetical protein